MSNQNEVVRWKADQLPAIPGELTETSLALREGLPFEEWQAVGQSLQRVERSVRWWIGDWLAYGERVYGETYAQAAEATGLKPESVRQAMWVSSQVESVRRRTGLSWSHHAEVASLEPSEQSRWLSKAESEGWSTRELKGTTTARNAPRRRCG